MSKTTIAGTRTYSEVECPNCATCFAVTELFEANRRDDHRLFYCPNGHSMSFTAKSEAERLREEKARLTHQLDQERAAKMTALGRADKAERKVRRVEKGVCPHCKRSFPNLARHMKCKHSKSARSTTENAE